MSRTALRPVAVLLATLLGFLAFFASSPAIAVVPTAATATLTLGSGTATLAGTAYGHLVVGVYDSVGAEIETYTEDVAGSYSVTFPGRNGDTVQAGLDGLVLTNGTLLFDDSVTADIAATCGSTIGLRATQHGLGVYEVTINGALYSWGDSGLVDITWSETPTAPALKNGDVVAIYWNSGISDGALTSGWYVNQLDAETVACGTVEAYVTRVYSDLFDRDPDPSGLATWTTALNSGTPYGRVASSITASGEYRSRLIRAAYQTYLGRDAEPAGLASWLAAMRAGKHIEQMQAGFISSPEFYARGGSSDRGWITLLYQTVLNRNPAVSEVDYWQQRSQQGATRSEIALGFLYSTEHLTTVVDGYYVDLLGRHIDPSGRTTWVGLIQTGSRDEQIIAGIVSSLEYRSKVGLV